MIFGLTNNGNTCYFNAGIQALLNIPELIEFILSDIYIKPIIDNLNLININQLLTTVTLQSRLLLKNDYVIKNPIDLHKQIINYNYNYNNRLIYPYLHEFRIGEQCDAYDLIMAFFRIIHDETKIKIKIPVKNDFYTLNFDELSKKDINTNIIGYTLENIMFYSYDFIKKNFENEFSIVKKYFVNEFINITECETCGYKSFSFSLGETYELNIDKEIKSDDGQTECASLYDYMNNQISVIDYSESNHHFIEKGHLHAYNIIKFWRNSKFLIIRIKRFITENNRNIKINKSIDIPEFLNIEKYIHRYNIKRSKSYIYELISAVQHIGSVNSGHYFCYAKKDSVWYEFNDSTVSKFANTPDLSKSYVLIYKKNSIL